MKKCPFCAEEIQDEAIKCRHCGTMLDQPVPVPAPVRDGLEDARELMRAGHKINAIKIVRERTGWGLKESKDFVDGGMTDAVRPGSDAARAAPQGFFEKARAAAEIKNWGYLNPAIICPQCQTTGRVRILPTKRKTGISGGKVMGALFTGGLSLLATGLSRKQQVTQAHCDGCRSTWDF